MKMMYFTIIFQKFYVTDHNFIHWKKIMFILKGENKQGVKPFIKKYNKAMCDLLLQKYIINNKKSMVLAIVYV